MGDGFKREKAGVFREGFAEAAAEDGAATGQVPTLDAQGRMEFADAGGGSLVGFAAHVNVNVPTGPGGKAIFDVVDFLSDDWEYDDITGRATCHAGGLYLIAAQLLFEVTANGPASEVGADININSTAWNVDPLSFDCLLLTHTLAANTWRGAVSAPLPLGDDCQISLSMTAFPFNVAGDVVRNTFLRAFKIGDDPSFH